MKLTEFKQRMRPYPLFTSQALCGLQPDTNTLRRQLSEWVKKGFVIQLKRGVYTLTDQDRNQPLSLFFVANQLYYPSYVSLESALSHYGLIPEKVTQHTSISTKKTQAFSNALGEFNYYHVKTPLFFGFKKIQQPNQQHFLIATPEKALFDYLYLKATAIKKPSVDFLEHSLRLQNSQVLDKKQLTRMAKQTQHAKLSVWAECILNFKEQHDD